MSNTFDTPDDTLDLPPHAVGDVLAYLQDALDPAARQTFEGHMAACTDCRTQLEFARQMHEDVVAHAARHVSPDRLVAHAEGRLISLAAAEATHLEGCSSCREDLAWARSAPPIPDEELVPLAAPAWQPARAPAAPARRLRFSSVWPAWAFGALVVAATVFTLVVVRPNLQMRSAMGDLAVVLPLPTPDDVRGDDPNAPIFRRALASYSAREYARAESLLVLLVRDRSADADALLYLGSSRLLLGHAPEAREPLATAARISRSPRLREEAHWQDAQAALLMGRPLEARALLEEIARTGTVHADEARVVLERLTQLR